VVPNAEVLGHGIDVGSVAIAVEYEFELIVASTQMFIGDFSAHDM
jgi:hypothetical protein